MTTNDPALAAATEIHMEPDWLDLDKWATIIRRHYAPLQQQLIGANVELAELRRANEIRTKSQQQLMAENARLQSNLALWHGVLGTLQEPLKSVVASNARLREALEAIRDQDYRGNRCYCSGIASAALKEADGAPR